MNGCYLKGNCPCQTGGCYEEPDEGCPVYRYFRNLIMKKQESIDRTMDEKKLKLLKLALKLGETAIDEVYHTAEYCENMRNDYYLMVEELAKILGLDYNDLV